MSGSFTSRYADWRAPSDDGQVLIWPPPPELLRSVIDNQRQLASAGALIQGVPLGELRRCQRQAIGHADEQPLLAAGHQTELYHPGVWAKIALVDAAARKLNARAAHIAVDTDAPKHLHLRWPGGSQPITQDPTLASAAWSGLLDAPTPSHLKQMRGELDAAAAKWRFVPLAGEVLASMAKLSMQRPRLPAALMESLHELDWRLGLRYDAILASPLWMGEPYLVLAHHVMARAEQFAQAYNAALGEYRVAYRIKAPGRPWPDLHVDADRCESPFWLDDLTHGTRVRATLVRHEGRWHLHLPAPVGQASSLSAPVQQASSLSATAWKAVPRGASFCFDPNADGWAAGAALGRFLHQQQLRISPRALMLTTFVRLLLADLFVHGIGGGRYDQVTDRVIAGFFGVEPPGFSVTTATLYFPLAAGQQRVNLYPLLQEGRRLRHGMLSQEKMRTVAEIAALPRRSTRRQELFFDMHRKLGTAWKGPAHEQWEQRLAEAQRIQSQQKAMFDRELFYALQPADRLERLIGQYKTQFGAA